MKKLIFSLGGSVVNPGKLNISFIKKIYRVVSPLNCKVGIVVGGGSIAREMVKSAQKLCRDNDNLDWIGIHITRANAQAVLGYFIERGEKVYPKVCLDENEASKRLKRYRFVFMGGTTPGHTTDYVAVRLAVDTQATEVVNVSNVDAVYTADPRKHKNAKKIPTMSHDELIDIVTQEEYHPSQNLVFDQRAARLAKKYDITLHFIGAKNISDVNKIVNGLPHRGTIVKS